MILALAVLVGIGASLVRHRGQTFAQIASIPLQSAWLVLLAVALQWPLLRAPGGPTQEVAVQQVLFLLSHLLLLAFVWRNRRLPGIVVAGLGIAINLLVILANGGFMPIAPEALMRIHPDGTSDWWPIGTHYGYSKDIILMREGTRLWPLSDVLVLPRPFPWPAAFSPGDLVIAAGIVVLLQGGKTSPASSLKTHAG